MRFVLRMYDEDVEKLIDFVHKLPYYNVLSRSEVRRFIKNDLRFREMIWEVLNDVASNVNMLPKPEESLSWRLVTS